MWSNFQLDIGVFRMKVWLREALGRSIAAARTEAGLTQEALGKRTELGQTVVSRIENGVRRVEFIELVSIAEALGVEVSALLDSSMAVPGPQGPEHDVVNLRLDDEHPGLSETLRPAVRLLERLAYLEERVAEPAATRRLSERR
jgi:transcriptional regulator with XRE-family HTH domain